MYIYLSCSVIQSYISPHSINTYQVRKSKMLSDLRVHLVQPLILIFLPPLPIVNGSRQRIFMILLAIYIEIHNNGSPRDSIQHLRASSVWPVKVFEAYQIPRLPYRFLIR